MVTNRKKPRPKKEFEQRVISTIKERVNNKTLSMVAMHREFNLKISKRPGGTLYPTQRPKFLKVLYKEENREVLDNVLDHLHTHNHFREFFGRQDLIYGQWVAKKAIVLDKENNLSKENLLKTLGFSMQQRGRKEYADSNVINKVYRCLGQAGHNDLITKLKKEEQRKLEESFEKKRGEASKPIHPDEGKLIKATEKLLEQKTLSMHNLNKEMGFKPILLATGKAAPHKNRTAFLEMLSTEEHNQLMGRILDHINNHKAFLEFFGKGNERAYTMWIAKKAKQLDEKGVLSQKTLAQEIGYNLRKNKDGSKEKLDFDQAQKVFHALSSPKHENLLEKLKQT